jgi:hypothetical protein
LAGKHRKHRRQRARNRRTATKFAALSVAAATASAVTIGATPLPDRDDAGRKIVDAHVDLAAAVNPFPGPNDIPDLTGGLGSAVSDFGQSAADALIRAIVESINLAAIANAAGLSPEAVLNNLLGGVLGEIPVGLLDDVVGSIPIDVSAVVDALLAPLGLGAGGLVGDLVAGGLPDTLGGLLGLLGVDLSDVLNLSDLSGPVNIVTAGPPFTLLKLLGVDLGWLPALPNSVANEINNSDYLDLEANLGDVLGALPAGDLILDVLGAAGITLPTLDVIEVRVPVVVGFGLGAFAAATGYQKVVDDLANQPGGPTSTEHPLLGSFTVLPMVLLFNPARPNGGAAARLYPLFSLFGINAVNPETEVTSRGGIPILNTGLSLGGANLVPVLVDAGVQYHPSSDFAAWPNPVSLANNLMAGLLPTYILRGLTLDTVPDQLTSQLADILAGVGSGPLKLNLYLTLPSATLPLLEPLYLASDLLNLATLGAFPVNPFNLVANAFSPVLTSLTNLGYTDVVYNPETGSYERTLTDAGTPMPFFSFPGIDWGQAPGVLFNQLLQGITKEFLSGNPTMGTPNALTGLLDLLSGLGGLGDLLGGLDLENVISGVLGGLNPDAASLAAQSDVPSPKARSMVESTDASDEFDSGTTKSETPATDVGDGDIDATDDTATDEESTDDGGTIDDANDDDANDDDTVDVGAANENESEDDSAAPSTGTVKTNTGTGNPVSSIVGSVAGALAPHPAEPDAGEANDAAAAGNSNDDGGNAGDNAA